MKGLIRGTVCVADHDDAWAEEAAAYSGLKKALAEQFPENRAEYTAGKQNFIECILRKAAARRREALQNQE